MEKIQPSQQMVLDQLGNVRKKKQNRELHLSPAIKTNSKRGQESKHEPETTEQLGENTGKGLCGLRLHKDFSDLQQKHDS